MSRAWSGKCDAAQIDEPVVRMRTGRLFANDGYPIDPTDRHVVTL